MFLVIVLTLTVFFWYMIWRLNAVSRTLHLWLDMLHNQNIKNIEQGRLDDLFEYDEVLPTELLSQMAFKFWKPIDSFKPIEVAQLERNDG